MESIYKNPTASEDKRVADLLSQMTLEEKLAQLHMHCNPQEILQMIENGSYPQDGISATYINRDTTDEVINKIQKQAVENTRLGIPMLVMGESLHGFMFPGATVFPQAIGLGATFNPDLLHKIGRICGQEAQALGVRMTYAPNLDLARDPRWGRVEETYGEDPYLVSQLGTAYIKGFQENKMGACPKHFIAYGSPEGGINIAPTHIGERELRENMFEPFRNAIQEGKAMGIMPSYGEIDGIPVHGSYYLLTEVLRDELGFEGAVIADFGAIHMLHGFHKIAATTTEAGKIALMAGVDVEAGQRGCQGEEFLAQVRNGSFPIGYVDTAVERILRVKIRLGLFEQPYAHKEYAKALHQSNAVATAKTAAHESMVLLKNDDEMLPLREDFSRIAVIGPNAFHVQLGDYTVPQALEGQSISLKDAMLTRFGESRVLCAEGCGVAKSSPELLEAAVDAAKSADVAIVALGDNSNFYGGVGWGGSSTDGTVTCGEGFDVSSLMLPDAQRELLAAVQATGTPVVLVLGTGRPYCIGEDIAQIPAVLQSWYPGEQGGDALCDVLFGHVNPSGKLPLSIPRSAGHIPCFYNHKPSARGYYKKPGSKEQSGRDYVFDTPAPLFPFGYGLSYTSFAYRDLSAAVQEDGKVAVTVTVENTGKRSGMETVLLYLRQHYCPVTPFVRRLRKFDKITLAPGESKTLHFILDEEDRSYIDRELKTRTGVGEFTVSVETLQCSFTV